MSEADDSFTVKLSTKVVKREKRKMRFEPGHPKVGGRKAGVPNKETNDLKERLEICGFDPVKEIGVLLPQLAPEKRVDVMLNLLGYLYPKRKAVEIAPMGGVNMEVANRLMQLSDEDLIVEMRSAIAAYEVDKKNG